MGLFRPSKKEINNAANEMAKLSIKDGKTYEEGVDEAMVFGMRYVRSNKLGIFKSAAFCNKYKLNLIDIGITEKEAIHLKKQLVLTLQYQMKSGF